MSKMLKLSIKFDLENCSSEEQLQDIKQKYSVAFQNAIDASEFNRMVKSKYVQIKTR